MALLIGAPRPAAATANLIAAAAVIAEMAALIVQMLAIKATVEQQRDQARSMFSGKLAPLASRLRVVNCFVARANGFAALPSAAAHCLHDLVEPHWYRDPAGAVIVEHVPFNTPPDVCTAATPPPLCYQDVPVATDVTEAAARVTSILDYGYGQRFIGPGGALLPPPDHVIARHARAAGLYTALGDGLVEASERFEQRTARHRSVVDQAMTLVEEWRGCQAAPPGSTLDLNDPRVPCVTNGGNGDGVGTPGTTGMMQELAAQLDLIESAQQGDPSVTQLDTIRLQVALMTARLNAGLVQLQAVRQEETQEALAASSSALRRSQELYKLRLDCLDGHYAGIPASPFNVLRVDPLGPADAANTVCVHVAEL